MYYTYTYHNKTSSKKFFSSFEILFSNLFICDNSIFVGFFFKELFLLDGKDSTLIESDIGRRNAIAKLLEEWGLLKVISNNHTDPIAPMSQIKVLPHREKSEWDLIPKYNIGVVNK